MPEQDNETLMRRLLDEAYNKRNLAVGGELLTADRVFHVIPIAIQGSAVWKVDMFYSDIWFRFSTPIGIGRHIAGIHPSAAGLTHPEIPG